MNKIREQIKVNVKIDKFNKTTNYIFTKIYVV